MKNSHKVPKKQWRKWSELARGVFNQVYRSMRYDYDVLFPPKAQNIPVKTLCVMAWNTAWIAADAANVKNA